MVLNPFEQIVSDGREDVWVWLDLELVIVEENRMDLINMTDFSFV